MEAGGKLLVRAARLAIAAKFGKAELPKLPEEKFGIFVTLQTYPAKELRGCIGFPEPRFPLSQGLPQAALAAAFGDPRFPPLTQEELKGITIEVSLLTPAKPVKERGEALLKKLTKKDGVILRQGYLSALFLPQVWEQLPDKIEFLEALCRKGGLPPAAWKSPETEVLLFQVEAFAEKSPAGPAEKLP